MIDWELSETKFNTTRDNYTKLSLVVFICNKCEMKFDGKLRRKKDVIDGQAEKYCLICSKERARQKLIIISTQMWQNETKAAQMRATKRTDLYRENQRCKALERYADPIYRGKVANANRINLSKPEVKKKLSDKTKQWWAIPANQELMKQIRESIITPEWRNKIASSMRKVWLNQDYRNNLISKMSERAIKLWSNQTYRDKIKIALLRYYNQDDVKLLISNKSIELWQTPAYRQKMAAAFAQDAVIIKLSNAAKKRWATDEYRSKLTDIIKKRWLNQRYRSRMLALMYDMLQRPETKEKLREISTARWSDPHTRQQLLASIKRVSNLQIVLYSILDDFKVVYSREYDEKPDDLACSIGPYSFDCVVERPGQKTLLIECNGDYWHTLPKSKGRDQAKATYINKYFDEQYELKYIWEHEFICRQKVRDLLKSWLFDKSEPESIIDFAFNQVVIKSIIHPEANLFLSKYHYLMNAGRGGIAYGAYINGVLIGVAVYSAPIRQNHDAKVVRELSRFCIHPAYQKKNFSSWFLSRTIKLLPFQYSKIVSFSDTTFDHVGTIYKAANFVLDGVVDKDYWYVSEDGWVMHKKTLYNHAVKMKLKESEFASFHGYQKVFGKKKLRFVYTR